MLRNWNKKKKSALHFLYAHTHTSKIKFTFYSCSQYWLLTDSKETCRDQTLPLSWLPFSLHVIKVELRLPSHFHSERCFYLPTIIFAVKIFQYHINFSYQVMTDQKETVVQLASAITWYKDKWNPSTKHLASSFVTALFGTQYIWNCSSTTEEIGMVFCCINPKFCKESYCITTYYRMHHCPHLRMHVNYVHIYISQSCFRNMAAFT